MLTYFPTCPFPYRNGFASLLAKKSTSGPMKNAGTYLVEPDIACDSSEAMDKLYEVI